MVGYNTENGCYAKGVVVVAIINEVVAMLVARVFILVAMLVPRLLSLKWLQSSS